MKVSIVVVTWNCREALATLVETMKRHLDPSRTQLVLVDNASHDDPVEAARKWAGDLETARLETNRGFGAASNAGVRLAAHEALVMLNPDTWLVDDSLFALAAASMRLDALAGPRVLNPDGTRQPSASASPVGAWPWARALVPVAMMPRSMVAHMEPWRLNKPTQVGWLTGACISAPRSRLLDLGPFDETIEMYGEDMDLGLRAATRGIPSYFLPNVARVVHVGDVSSSVRYSDGGLALTAARTAQVIGRHHGPVQTRRALQAELLRTRARVFAKRACGASAERDQAWLAALRRTTAENLQTNTTSSRPR